MATPDELVEEVDEHDQVVRVVTRAEMRARRLRHRASAVVVRDPAGRVLVHRRADTKDVWPGRWDLAAGGVLACGESYHAGALRELAEELGITGVAVHELGRGRFEDDDVRVVLAVFSATWDGPVAFPDGEVAEARWVDFDELDHMVATLAFVPDSVALALPHLAGRT